MRDDDDQDDDQHAGPELPGWAGFFDWEQMEEFLALVSGALTDQGVEHEVHADQGLVELRGEDESARLLGLGNLAQLCRRLPREDWEEAISEHIAHLMRLPDEDGELLERLGADFEEARGYLKLRLFADGLPNEEQLVLRRPMEGVVSVLVYDFPHVIATVPREHVTNWCKFDDELWEIALEAVRGDAPEREEVEIEEGVSATILAGASFFSATHALLLDEHMGKGPGRGSLVAIPHRHVVLIHEIRDATVILALDRMARLAAAMHSEGPGSISPTVYWYDRGRFLSLPAKVGKEKVEVRYPKEFMEMLRDLAG